VAEPLIPYIDIPDLPLRFLEHVPVLGRYVDPAHPPALHKFGLLVATGVYLGSIVAMRHARDRRLDEKKMSDFIFWVLLGGFVCAHVLDVVFYYPQKLLRDPLSILRLWESLSSFGGFTGAILGALAWRYHHRERILPYVDTVTSAFPLAWLFGRAGCSLAHDHPGRVSDAWYALKWPGVVGRYDLGLYELVLCIPLAAFFAWSWRRGPRAVGWYTGMICVYYAPVRFLLDFLREEDRGGLIGGDPRYAGLTPAQWGCFGLFLLGLWFLRYASKHAGAAPPPPVVEGDEHPAAKEA
jgi:phosphatidylglycerol:prolipoprotein diacylglycerol transferase